MGKNRNKQWDLIVIGAGAAGMMAAITAARNGKSVCIIEKMDKLGKKILATGNGKCNFTNEILKTDAFHGDESFIKNVLLQFSLQDCLSFFHSIGVYPKNKNGYYYPNSEQAASVVFALEQELLRLNVECSLSNSVLAIDINTFGAIVRTTKGPFSGKHILIATGLLAAPKLGSDGSIFSIVKDLGHRFRPILPALCGFYCKGLPFKKISGVRVQGNVQAWIDDVMEAEDTGEVQLTDYGMSGIPVFQISHYLSQGLYHKQKVQIRMKLLADMNFEQLYQELLYRKEILAQTSATYLLNGLLPQKLADWLLEAETIQKGQSIAELSKQQLQQLAHHIQNISVEVTNYRDFEFAQVCCGGIPTSDVNPDTLESRLAPHVYFAGEILDVDGICGGYNLHFAWATGSIVGKAVSQ